MRNLARLITSLGLAHVVPARLKYRPDLVSSYRLVLGGLRLTLELTLWQCFTLPGPLGARVLHLRIFGAGRRFCFGFSPVILFLGLVVVSGFCWAFRFLGVFAWAAAAAAAAALRLCAFYLGAAHIEKFAAQVVTGVFCSTAIESATADKDVATIKQVRMKKQQARSDVERVV